MLKEEQSARVREYTTLNIGKEKILEHGTAGGYIMSKVIRKKAGLSQSSKTKKQVAMPCEQQTTSSVLLAQA